MTGRSVASVLRAFFAPLLSAFLLIVLLYGRGAERSCADNPQAGAVRAHLPPVEKRGGESAERIATRRCVDGCRCWKDSLCRAIIP